MSNCQKDAKLWKRCQFVKKSNIWTMEEVHKKVNWHNEVNRYWCQFWHHIWRSPKTLKMSIEIIFDQFQWPSCVTSKLMSIYVIVQLFDFLTIWALCDNLTSFQLKPLQSVTGWGHGQGVHVICTHCMGYIGLSSIYIYALLCPCAPLPMCPITSVPHLDLCIIMPMYPSPMCPIVHVPHHPCHHLDLHYYAHVPIAHVPHWPCVPSTMCRITHLDPCNYYANVPHGWWGAWAMGHMGDGVH